MVHDCGPAEHSKRHAVGAGRYRVGVDFHGPCDETVVSGKARKQGLYVVRVDVDGRILERRGMVIPGHFEVIVIEFDIESDIEGPERP